VFFPDLARWFYNGSGEEEVVTGNEGLEQQVTLRVSKEDVARLDALTEEMPLKRSALIRAALRLGLELIEEDPARLLRKRQRRRSSSDSGRFAPVG
jgi:predicted transcriptional regulator